MICVAVNPKKLWSEVLRMADILGTNKLGKNKAGAWIIYERNWNELIRVVPNTI